MLTNTERQQIVEEVNAGTYGIDEALDDIAAAQKGEEVRKALYAEALVLNREGHAGSTDLIARQQIANLQTSVNGQISTLRTEVGEDIDDLETALNSGLATQNGKIAAQDATIANVVANYNVEYGSTELWASTGETGALAAGTTVTLSEDVSHFDYIDIYSFCGNSNVLDTVPVDAKLQSNAGYALRWVNLSDPGSGSYKAYVRIIETRLHIIGTTLTIDHQVTYRNGEEVNISGAEITQSNRSTYVGELGIMKVVGRKITANTEVTDMRIGADGTTYQSAGQALRSQIGDLGGRVDDLESQGSDDATAIAANATAIAANTAEITSINGKIGNLSSLATEAKNDLVAAINEAAQTGGGNDAELPKMYITGDISEMTGSKNEVKKYSYVFVEPDGKQHFGYCSMKWQGESSLSYPKKNYTIKFFANPAHSRKESVDLLPLGIKKNKFVVKANWIDRSQARNVVSCRLWGQMVKSRHAAPPTLLAGAPNFGAINGYPIKIYVNGAFHGLYTFNLPKDADLFNMDEDNPLHCVVCGDDNSNSDSNASAFRSSSLSDVAGDWELEVPDKWQSYTEEVEGETVTHAVQDNLASTIDFVMTATDAEFVEHLNDHIDVESAIDYYLLMFIERGVDSAARNLILLTYDGGNKWYCSAYDKDMTWGNGMTGNPGYTADTPCPGGYNNANSLLWERLVECFGDDIWTRWCELKTTILSPDYIKAEFAYFWRDITDADYAADIEKWSTMPQATYEFKNRIANFIDARWAYMDGVIRAMRTPVACTGITLSEPSISFTSTTPITLTATVTPADTTDTLTWASSNNSVATVNNGVVTPVGEGNATITAYCGNQTASCSVSVASMYHTVTLVGSNAALSPTTPVTPGAAYSGTLTVNVGYALDSVVVTMGGTDITSTAYSNGTITIASVTGAVVVTVVTSLYIDPTGLVYALDNPVTFDGETDIDTGYKYTDITKSLSVFVEAENPQDMITNQYFFGAANASNAMKFALIASGRSLVPCLNTGSLQNGLPATVGAKFVMVYRFDASRTVHSNRSAMDGVEKTNRYGINTNGLQSPRDVWAMNLHLGCRYNSGAAADPMLSGKLLQLRIYERRLTDAEVCALLGVDSLSTVITADLDPTS